MAQQYAYANMHVFWIIVIVLESFCWCKQVKRHIRQGKSGVDHVSLLHLSPDIFLIYWKLTND